MEKDVNRGDGACIELRNSVTTDSFHCSNVLILSLC